MKRMLVVVGLALLASVAATNVAHARPPVSPPGHRPSSVPEIDPLAAGSVVTVLVGATLLFDARRSRSKRRQLG